MKTAPWLVICAAIALLLFATGLIVTTYFGGLTRMSLGFAVLCVVGVLGVVDVVRRRVVLEPDRLSVVSLWSRQVYPRAEIDSVTWDAGVGVALKLVSGRWVRLPELGRNSQSVTNTIRAWLKRTAAGGA